jgi:hypothetical protein
MCPFCCVCLCGCAAEFGSSGGTYELPCIILQLAYLYFIVTVNFSYNCSTREFKVTDSSLNKASKYSSVLRVGHKTTFNRYDFIRSNAFNIPHIQININAGYWRGTLYWTTFGSIWPHSAAYSRNEANSNSHLVNVKNLNKPIPVAAQSKAWVACWDCGFESRRRHGCM